jgi:hypothetical protein
MHTHSIEDWRHDHAFLGHQHDQNEFRTRLVIGLTLVMMFAKSVLVSLSAQWRFSRTVYTWPLTPVL